MTTTLTRRSSPITRRNYAGNSATGTITPAVVCVSGTLSAGTDFLRMTTTTNATANLAQRFAQVADFYAPAAPGDVWTLSYEARTGLSPTMQSQLVWFTAGGSAISTVESPPAAHSGAFTFLPQPALTAIAPALTAFVGWRVGLATGARPIGHLMDIRNVKLEKAAVAGTYFDGDTVSAGASFYGWLGTRQASTAVQYTYSYTDPVTPRLMLGYESKRATKNVIHPNPSGGPPDVSLRPAGTRSGTLRFLANNFADALAVESLHASAQPLRLVDTDNPLANMYYVATGEILVKLDPETLTRFTVDVGFQEVNA